MSPSATLAAMQGQAFRCFLAFLRLCKAPPGLQ